VNNLTLNASTSTGQNISEVQVALQPSLLSSNLNQLSAELIPGLQQNPLYALA